MPQYVYANTLMPFDEALEFVRDMVKQQIALNHSGNCTNVAMLQEQAWSVIELALMPKVIEFMGE